MSVCSHWMDAAIPREVVGTLSLLHETNFSLNSGDERVFEEFSNQLISQLFFFFEDTTGDTTVSQCDDRPHGERRDKRGGAGSDTSATYMYNFNRL